MTEKRNIDSFARPVTSNGCANLVFYSTHLPLSPFPFPFPPILTPPFPKPRVRKSQPATQYPKSSKPHTPHHYETPARTRKSGSLLGRGEEGKGKGGGEKIKKAGRRRRRRRERRKWRKTEGWKGDRSGETIRRRQEMETEL